MGKFWFHWWWFVVTGGTSRVAASGYGLEYAVVDEGAAAQERCPRRAAARIRVVIIQEDAVLHKLVNAWCRNLWRAVDRNVVPATRVCASVRRT